MSWPEEAEASYAKAALVLTRAARAGRYRSVLVSSPSSEAGATTVTLQIARHLRRTSGMRALVVELNAVRPVFARWFGLESERGLEALLRGEKTVPECIQRGGDGLALLPAGVENRAPGADRGLPSAIERILAETKSDFDLVLFDAPPILEQPVVLAAGAVVPRLLLVVEAGRTPHELLTRVKQQAEAEGIEIVGAILNKQRWYIPKWLYLWVTR